MLISPPSREDELCLDSEKSDMNNFSSVPASPFIPTILSGLHAELPGVQARRTLISLTPAFDSVAPFKYYLVAMTL